MMKISQLGTTFTITFKNTGRGDEITTWVCETPSVYKRNLETLRECPHIEIIHHGNSLVYLED